MFAIKTGEKFLNVRYFLNPTEVFGTALTGKTMGWKTRAEAETHLSRARAYFAARIDNMAKVAAEAHRKAAAAQARVIKLKAELELLVEQPYKDVHMVVARKLKELDRRESEVAAESDAAQDYGRTLKKFEKLAAADYKVVLVKQVVDAELV